MIRHRGARKIDESTSTYRTRPHKSESKEHP
jgi:hypothetical protein